MSLVREGDTSLTLFSTGSSHTDFVIETAIPEYFPCSEPLRDDLQKQYVREE